MANLRMTIFLFIIVFQTFHKFFVQCISCIRHVYPGELDSDIQVEVRKLTDISLTRREIECLCYWLRGCSIKESAKNIGGLS